MDTVIWAVIVSGAVVSLLVFLAARFICAYYSNRRTAREKTVTPTYVSDEKAAILEWLSTAAERSDEELLELGPPPADVEDFEITVDTLQVQRYYAVLANQKIEDIRLITDPMERWEALRQTKTQMLTKPNWTKFGQLELATLSDVAEGLISSARRGDMNAFKKLKAMKKDDYLGWLLIELDVPRNYNELVADLVYAPKISSFMGLQYDPSLRTVIMLAAKAARTESGLYAKIVIAYCLYNDDYRKVLGDVLFAELVKIAEAHNALKGWFVDRPNLYRSED